MDKNGFIYNPSKSLGGSTMLDITETPDHL